MDDPKLPWISRLKLRALAWVVAIALAVVAMLSFVGLPWAPVVGVGLVAAAVSVSKLTRSLAMPTCFNCGRDLRDQPIGVHGIHCPACGSVRSPSLIDLARLGTPRGLGTKTDDNTPGQTSGDRRV